MVVPQQQGAASFTARLNPFVFPADTILRFTLLIVALVSASLFAFNWLHSLVHQADQPAIIQCQLAARTAYPVNPEQLQSDQEQYTQQLAAQAAASELCIAPFNHTALLWMLCGTLTLFMVATAIYLAQPMLRIRRDRLKPLSAPKFQSLRLHLNELQQQANIQQPIIYLTNPTSREVGGIAFGRLGRYYIALPGGLLVKFLRDRQGFDAIILHELAHQRNNDIDITYFTIALWRAFVVIALIPFAAALIVSFFLFETPILALSVAWRIVPLTALVYVYHRGVLRAREYYADIRASTWIDAPDALVRVASSSTPLLPNRWTRMVALIAREAARWTKKRPLPRMGQRISQMLAFHPDSKQRIAALADPSMLFPIQVEEVIGIGVVAGVAMPQLSFVAQLLVPTIFEMLAFVLAALFVGPLIAGVFGIGIWRGVFADALTKRSAPKPFLLTGGLVIGVAAGAFISFDAAIPLVGPGKSMPALLDRAPDALFFVMWCVLLLAVFYVFVRWVQCTAETWVPTVTKHRSLRRALRVNLTLIGILLIFWIALLFINYSLGIEGLIIISAVVFSGHIGDLIQFAAPLIMVSSTLLWALPLFAILSRAIGEYRTPRWAFLDIPADTPAALSFWGYRTSPRFAILAGIAGGLIVGVLLIFMSIGKNLLIPQAVQQNGHFLDLYWYTRLALIAMLQAALAGFVAATIPLNGWIYGLCATFFAGAFITLSMLGLNILNGGTTSFQMSWAVYAQVATWSAVVAIPVALISNRFGNRNRRHVRRSL